MTTGEQFWRGSPGNVDVGEDTGSPIIEDVYAVPFRNEALRKLTVKVVKD